MPSQTNRCWIYSVHSTPLPASPPASASLPSAPPPSALFHLASFLAFALFSPCQFFLRVAQNKHASSAKGTLCFFFSRPGTLCVIAFFWRLPFFPESQNVHFAAPHTLTHHTHTRARVPVECHFASRGLHTHPHTHSRAVFSHARCLLLGKKGKGLCL